MPIKAGALALATKAARAVGDTARANQLFSELKQVVGDEYPVEHPVFTVDSVPTRSSDSL